MIFLLFLSWNSVFKCNLTEKTDVLYKTNETKIAPVEVRGRSPEFIPLGGKLELSFFLKGAPWSTVKVSQERSLQVVIL